MAYIYQIINDINQKIYVGKTEFSIEKRFKEHCKDAFRERNEKRPLYSAMRKYGVEHFHIELIEETDDANNRETYWIEKLGSFKWGYNATIGGDGKKYLDYDLIIASYQEIKNIEETARKLGISSDSVERILKEKKEKIYSQQEVNLVKSGKKVAQCDKKTGKILNIFPSIGSAGRAINKPDITHISAVCLGKRQSAYSYKWKFIENN